MPFNVSCFSTKQTTPPVANQLLDHVTIVAYLILPENILEGDAINLAPYMQNNANNIVIYHATFRRTESAGQSHEMLKSTRGLPGRCNQHSMSMETSSMSCTVQLKEHVHVAGNSVISHLLLSKVQYILRGFLSNDPWKISILAYFLNKLKTRKCYLLSTSLIL